MNYIFFGTPHFAEIILEKLIQQGYKPSLVVAAPDKPIGRKQILTPPPVKVLAEEHGIPVIQPETLINHKQIPNYKSQIQNIKPELFIVAAYGKILPKELLDIPKHGAMNIHPSLLPKYRGPSPIQYSILNGDDKTGVTIMLMDEKMDHGPLLSQREFRISSFEFRNGKGKPTYEELHNLLANKGAELIIETITKYIKGKIKPREQDHSKATYTKIITREDGRIDWNKTAPEIERMLRAFTPWPGVFTTWNNKRFKMYSLEIQEEEETKEPGKVIEHEDSFAIETGKGLIIPKEVQLEGKNPQNAKEFIKGHGDIIGSILKN